ncbi:hypothetical protein [Burkholderia cepacia]|uniref:hypothetical protein n=1 Tax=Burkholderia cepacia TaxID=292 RepID=UPI002ABD7ED1|nr:hypothetical protein [Burkholderia cepacia]
MAMTNFDAWADGARFALNTVSDQDQCFLSDAAKQTAIETATETCASEMTRLATSFTTSSEARLRSDTNRLLRAEAEFHVTMLGRLAKAADDRQQTDVAGVYQTTAAIIERLIRDRWGRPDERERGELIRGHEQRLVSWVSRDTTD